MIDWLRRDPSGKRPDPFGNPVVEVAGRALPIAIRRHQRARRLTMRLAPDGGELRVTMPRWGRSLDAIAFANARRSWIEAQLAKVPQQVAITAGSTIRFRGRELTIGWHEQAPRQVQLQGDTLELGGPRQRIEPRVQKWLEARALDLCAQDLAFYCQRASQPVPAFALSRARRRWGSCAGDQRSGQRIRINWRLVMAPDEVRRSVVAHEVAHLTHFDHSPAFHRHLGELFEGDLDSADGWLRQHGPTLYACFR